MQPRILLVLLLVACGWTTAEAEPPWSAPASLAAASPAPAGGGAPAGPPENHGFAGGGIGLSFGDVDFVEVFPMVGYRFNRRFALGLELLYRYRKDSRFVRDVSTTDYGATLFGRYHVTPVIFLEADLEYLDFEFIQRDLSTDRFTEENLLAGVGLSQPMGARASFYAVALYNFTFDDEFPSAYSDPWVFRVGVAVGF